VETRELIRLLLERAGLQVEEAENGLEGLKKAVETPYDVILMDVNMPVMDGFTAARKMRKNRLKTPIVALTANAMKGFEKEVLEAGYSEYLTKPIEFDPFMKLMAELVGGKQVKESIGDDLAPAAPTEEEARTHEKKKTPAAIVSKLPADNEAFQTIIVKFSDQLRKRLAAVKQARRKGDRPEIASFAHWLKGAGGTVGFDDFTEPAKRLEQLAKGGGKSADIDTELKTILRLAGRLYIPGKDGGSPPAGGNGNGKGTTTDRTAQSTKPSFAPVEPLISTLGDDPTFQRIIGVFIQTLDNNMEKMEAAYRDKDWEELASLAHWLKGSGGTVGFPAFTEPAQALEKAAKEMKPNSAGEMLDRIKELKGAIVSVDANSDGQGGAPTRDPSTLATGGMS
jgi:CheY-like chemotaxis protein